MEVSESSSSLREPGADEMEEIIEQLHHHNIEGNTEHELNQAAINLDNTSLPCPTIPACINGDARTLDEGVASRVAAPVTPKKRKRSESGIEPGDQGDHALTPTRRRFSPEEREALRVQKEEEKLRKAEEKKKKEEARERKKKELEEKKAQKELEKAKRDAEREEKKRFKEEEKARKEEERKKKEEDKKRKEEDKMKKEERRKKREEERKKKEDERTKELEAKVKLAEKQKSLLTSFLKKAAPSAAEAKPAAVRSMDGEDGEEGDSLFHFHRLFKGVDVPPHTVRSSYLPTPVPGIGRLTSHEIDAALVNNTDRSPSLADWQAELCSRKLARRAYEKLQRETRQRGMAGGDEAEEDSDVMLVEQSAAMNASSSSSSQRSLRRRMKFFKFHENNRPAYFGTYSKTSHCITPRSPFKQDTLLLDYECDSDDDWEDEGEGESLEDSEGEEEEDEITGEYDDDDDDEEEDDGFMVPDGYLSEDEGVEDSDAEDDELGSKGKEKVGVGADGMDLEAGAPGPLAKEKERRRRWKEKQRTNEEGGKGGKVVKLRTVAIGPVFCMRSADVPLQYSRLFADFGVRVLADLTNGPIDPEETPAKDKAEPRDSSLPDVVLRDLIRNVHGDTMGVKHLVGRFYDKYVTEPSLQRYTLTKNGLIKKVREIAVREKRADDTKGMDEECAQILATRRQADSVTPRKKRIRPSLTGATTTMTPTIAAAGGAAAQPATPSAAPVVAATLHHWTPELPSTPSSAPLASVLSTPERKRGGAAKPTKPTKDIMNFFNAAAASPSKPATTSSTATTPTASASTPSASSSTLASPSSSAEASGVIAAGSAMDVDPLMPDTL